MYLWRNLDERCLLKSSGKKKCNKACKRFDFIDCTMHLYLNRAVSELRKSQSRRTENRSSLLGSPYIMMGFCHRNTFLVHTTKSSIERKARLYPWPVCSKEISKDFKATLTKISEIIRGTSGLQKPVAEAIVTLLMFLESGTRYGVPGK